MSSPKDLAKLLNLHTNNQLITLSEYYKMFETVIVMDGWDGNWDVESGSIPNVTTVIFDDLIKELKSGDRSLIYIKNDNNKLQYKESVITITDDSVYSTESDWKKFI